MCEIDSSLKKCQSLKLTINEGINFNILICGIQSSGKSTFINAMIGQDLLPSHTMLRTMQLYPIKYNDKI